MSYIHDPRSPYFWESDGEYDGKYKAIDGTLHDSAEEATKHERMLPEAVAGNASAPVGEKRQPSGVGEPPHCPSCNTSLPDLDYRAEGATASWTAREVGEELREALRAKVKEWREQAMYRTQTVREDFSTCADELEALGEIYGIATVGCSAHARCGGKQESPQGGSAIPRAPLPSNMANDLAALAAPAPKPAPPTFEVPFQKPLTVLLVKDRSQEQASADIAAIKKNDSTVLRIVSEMYFHQLRLECAKDPTLLDKIAVFYRDENNVLHAIGLRFEDELKWPPGFLQEGWSLEVEISKVRLALRRAAERKPPR